MMETRGTMEKNPFDKVFDKIAEIIQYTYDNADKPIPLENSPDINKKLDELEKQIQAFKKISEASTTISDYTFQTMMTDEKNENITKEEKEILLRAEALKKEAKKAAQNTAKAAKEARDSGLRLTEKPKQEKPTTSQGRKGKFKSMGGFKNWKPL